MTRSPRTPPRGPLLAAALAALAGCGGAATAPRSGFLDAPTSAVAAQVAGRIDAIPVREGDRVRAGQLLARLDAREREAQVAQAEATLDQSRISLREAEANLAAAEPTVGGAGADVARARATLDEAESNFDRTDQLVRGSAASAQQLDAARARLLEARAALASLTAGKASVQGRVTAARAAVATARGAVAVASAAVATARVQLSEAEVRAPFDGLVVDRDLEPGEWAAPGTPVVTVEDLGRLWVRLDLEERSLADLRLGQPVEVRLQALPGRTFRAHVIEIGALGGFAVNRDVKRGRPDLRTFRVRAALDDRDEALRPGMTAEVVPAAGAAAGSGPGR